MRKNIARIYPEKETRRRKKKGKKEGEGFTNRNREKEQEFRRSTIVRSRGVEYKDGFKVISVEYKKGLKARGEDEQITTGWN